MKRHGILLVELTVAVTLLAVAIAVWVEVLAVAASQRRAAAERQLATQEAGNLMERLAAMPWADLRPESVPSLPLSPEGKRLPGVQSAIELTRVDGPPKAVRLVVSLRWEDRNGRLLPPLRLVAWRYP
jgi:hypothetical protein